MVLRPHFNLNSKQYKNRLNKTITDRRVGYLQIIQRENDSEIFQLSDQISFGIQFITIY